MTAGFGRMLRKEDQRFVRGQGTYTDDVHLPGMLYGAVLRSPHPHARILSIDTVAAEAHPKVKAVRPDDGRVPVLTSITRVAAAVPLL